MYTNDTIIIISTWFNPFNKILAQEINKSLFSYFMYVKRKDFLGSYTCNLTLISFEFLFKINKLNFVFGIIFNSYFWIENNFQMERKH